MSVDETPSRVASGPFDFATLIRPWPPETESKEPHVLLHADHAPPVSALPQPPDTDRANSSAPIGVAPTDGVAKPRTAIAAPARVAENRVPNDHDMPWPSESRPNKERQGRPFHTFGLDRGASGPAWHDGSLVTPLRSYSYSGRQSRPGAGWRSPQSPGLGPRLGPTVISPWEHRRG